MGLTGQFRVKPARLTYIHDLTTPRDGHPRLLFSYLILSYIFVKKVIREISYKIFVIIKLLSEIEDYT